MTITIDAVLADLAETIAERARNGGASSYTRKLVDRGMEKCAQKLGEEAVEAAIAAVAGDREGLKAESADLLYHLLVVLHAAGISLDEVAEELRRREARSGVEEKAARRHT